QPPPAPPPPPPAAPPAPFFPPPPAPPAPPGAPAPRPGGAAPPPRPRGGAPPPPPPPGGGVRAARRPGRPARGGGGGRTGAEGALPIWIDFVRATAGPGAGRPFEVPDDIVWRDVDPSSGLLATAGCPEVRREPFLAGTEPQRPCDRHRAVWTAVGEGLGD